MKDNTQLMLIDLFKRLKTECKKHQIDINEFWKYHGPLKTGLQQFLKDTFPDISFKRSNNFIQKRIRKIGKNVEFSVRERMLLKRLLRKQNDKKNINYSKLEYYLPGKTAEIIKNEINSIYNA